MKRYLDKRLLGIALFSILTALATESEAHYLLVSGTWYYHSVHCNEGVNGVKNPDKFPSVVQCEVEPLTVDTLCYNPSSSDVRPGASATMGSGIKYTGQNQVDSSEIDSPGHAKVSSTVIAEDNLLGFGSEVCVNDNWQLIKVAVTGFKATAKTYECADLSCSSFKPQPASIVVSSCKIPAWYDIFDDYSNLYAEPVQYDCVVESSQHLY